jgi:hypothetical protein
MTPQQQAMAADRTERRLRLLTHTLNLAGAIARQMRPDDSEPPRVQDPPETPASDSQRRPHYEDPAYGLTATQADAQRRIARCTCGAWVLLPHAAWLALVELDIRATCDHYGRPEAP